MIEIVPATYEQVISLYGQAQGKTVRAVAAVEDGQVLGVAGIYMDMGQQVVFAKLDEQLRKDRRAVLAGARRTMAMFGRQVFAMCDSNEPTADGFLRHFGFEPIGNGVYRWKA